jgi:hypothetical protein
MFGKNWNLVVDRTGGCGGGDSAAGGNGESCEREVGATESEDDVFVV